MRLLANFYKQNNLYPLMKKGVMLLALLVFSITLVSAEACDLTTTLLNQDPYPAVQGDYVKLVFQITGLAEDGCGDIKFSLQEDYPIKFNPGENGRRTFSKLSYANNYQSTIQISYEVRIDSDAVDGTNTIDAIVQNNNDDPIIKTFNLEVSDSLADFEVYVKGYDMKSNELTLEVLNIENVDVEALTVSIPKQTNVIIKGPNRVIVGDLDSNEYTTADFEATVRDGEITVDLTYSDTINIRRTITKTITFESEYFMDRIADQKTTSMWTYIFGVVVVLLIIWWIVKKFTKKKKRN